MPTEQRKVEEAALADGPEEGEGGGGGGGSLALTVGMTRATWGRIQWIGRPRSDHSMKQTSSRLLFSIWELLLFDIYISKL